MGSVLANQIWVLAVALVCGLLTAFFYDIYWLLIASRRPRPLLCALQDMLFWLAAFCLVAALWIFCTGGLMRLYVYLWLGLGIFLFRHLFSPRLRRLHKPPSTRKSYSIPPKLQYAATLPSAAMLRAGYLFWRCKPKLVASCRNQLKFLRGAVKNIFAPFFSKKERD